MISCHASPGVCFGRRPFPCGELRSGMVLFSCPLQLAVSALSSFPPAGSLDAFRPAHVLRRSGLLFRFLTHSSRTLFSDSDPSRANTRFLRNTQSRDLALGRPKACPSPHTHRILFTPDLRDSDHSLLFSTSATHYELALAQFPFFPCSPFRLFSFSFLFSLQLA
jgi:hypothetical protein